MRKVDVGTDKSTSGSSYKLDVHNSRASTVTVSYSDGTGTYELGSVKPGATESFTVVTKTGWVDITGETSSGTRLSATRVTLNPSGTTYTIH
jgi:hypothetical protein